MLARVWLFLLLVWTASSWACGPLPGPSAARRIAVIAPGFPVAKIAMAPDGSGLAIAGRGGAAAVLRFSDGVLHKNSTAIDNPVSRLYAPDSSEVWVSGRGGGIARLNPATAGSLDGTTQWETNAAGLHISTTTPGRYVLTDLQRRIEITGRIVALADGRLAIGGAVLVAGSPQRIAAFRVGALEAPPQWESTPVGAMGEACGGTCLLIADSAQARNTYFWGLAPLDSTPRQIPGSPFLDAGDLAADCRGASALRLADGQLQRIALPPGAAPDGAARTLNVARAKLSGDGRHALVMDPNTGWHVYNAQTLAEIPAPDWLAPEQPHAVLAADGAYAVYADRLGGARLVATPYRAIRRFPEDLEIATPVFGTTGTTLVVAKGGGWRLLRSADGQVIAELPGGRVAFAPGDGHLVVVGERLLLYRLSR